MEIKKLIKDLKKRLSEIQSQGSPVVEIDGLQKYLDVVEQETSNAEAISKHQYELALTQIQEKTHWNTELFKAEIEAGKSALHSLIIINGGAVIALMGIMANLVSKTGGEVLISNLTNPMLVFGLGVLCGGAGFALRYLSQFFYTQYSYSEHSKSRYKTLGNIFKSLAIGAGLLGFIFFGYAIYDSFKAFKCIF